VGGAFPYAARRAVVRDVFHVDGRARPRRFLSCALLPKFPRGCEGGRTRSGGAGPLSAVHGDEFSTCLKAGRDAGVERVNVARQAENQ